MYTIELPVDNAQVQAGFAHYRTKTRITWSTVIIKDTGKVNDKLENIYSFSAKNLAEIYVFLTGKNYSTETVLNLIRTAYHSCDDQSSIEFKSDSIFVSKLLATSEGVIRDLQKKGFRLDEILDFINSTIESNANAFVE